MKQILLNSIIIGEIFSVNSFSFDNFIILQLDLNDISFGSFIIGVSFFFFMLIYYMMSPNVDPRDFERKERQKLERKKPWLK